MDPFRNYDSWLEAPFQQMCAEYDAFIDWCEANDIDPEDPAAEDMYNDAMADDDAWEDDYYSSDDEDFWDE